MHRENTENEAKHGRVRRLPDALVDQIAAGEVVERPASVVKELVENALDAGSRRVRVEIRGGGRDWIAVTDDGRGMSPEDARLALQRHATSKIGTLEDLQTIRTYGFRGEALPAIASVSRLRVRTRPQGSPLAWELRVDAGHLIDEREAGGPEGTRIEVADLFSAIPARRKFLKTPATEWGHSADWLARAALALPGVHFDIRRDDRPALVWPSTNEPLDRVASVVSEADAAAFVPVERHEGAASLQGFVSRPDHHRPTLAGVYLFVNQRPVRDRVLQHALVEVYRDLLPRGRFPSAVIFLDVPPDAVDVNVHPAKWEVRFSDPRFMHRLVSQAVRGAIESRSWLPGAGAHAAGESPAGGLDSGNGFRGGASSYGSHTSPPTGSLQPPTGSQTPSLGSQAPSLGSQTPSLGDWTFARGADSAGLLADRGGADSRPGLRFSEMRLIGQGLATYLVLEGHDGLLLIDQHAAHERVLYERLRAEWLERGVERQGLLLPVTLKLAPGSLISLCGPESGAGRLGFDLEAFGEDTILIRAIPGLLSGQDPAHLVQGLADEIAAGGPSAPEAGARALDAADRIFASLACHSARRKGDLLGAEEQRALLESLDTIPWAPTCPHGRPVAIPLELAEIERRFSRR